MEAGALRLGTSREASCSCCCGQWSWDTASNLLSCTCRHMDTHTHTITDRETHREKTPQYTQIHTQTHTNTRTSSHTAYVWTYGIETKQKGFNNNLTCYLTDAVKQPERTQLTCPGSPGSLYDTSLHPDRLVAPHACAHMHGTRSLPAHTHAHRFRS